MKKENLFLSTIATDAPKVAREYGLCLEIAEYCTAWNMDEKFAGVDPVVFVAVFEPVALVCHICNLTKGHAVYYRYRKASYSRFVFLQVKDRAVYIESYWVRAVEYNELFAVNCTCCHHFYHCYIVGVEAYSHILKVKYKNIKLLHYLRRRLACLALIK